jgi:hypothetical protein
MNEFRGKMAVNLLLPCIDDNFRKRSKRSDRDGCLDPWRVRGKVFEGLEHDRCAEGVAKGTDRTDPLVSLSESVAVVGENGFEVLNLALSKRAVSTRALTVGAGIINDAAKIGGYETLCDIEQVFFDPAAAVKEDEGPTRSGVRDEPLVSESFSHSSSPSCFPRSERSSCQQSVESCSVRGHDSVGFQR